MYACTYTHIYDICVYVHVYICGQYVMCTMFIYKLCYFLWSLCINIFFFFFFFPSLTLPAFFFVFFSFSYASCVWPEK